MVSDIPSRIPAVFTDFHDKTPVQKLYFTQNPFSWRDPTPSNLSLWPSPANSRLPPYNKVSFSFFFFLLCCSSKQQTIRSAQVHYTSLCVSDPSGSLCVSQSHTLSRPVFPRTALSLYHFLSFPKHSDADGKRFYRLLIFSFFFFFYLEIWNSKISNKKLVECHLKFLCFTVALNFLILQLCRSELTWLVNFIFSYWSQQWDLKYRKKSVFEKFFLFHLNCIFTVIYQL